MDGLDVFRAESLLEDGDVIDLTIDAASVVRADVPGKRVDAFVCPVGGDSTVVGDDRQSVDIAFRGRGRAIGGPGHGDVMPDADGG